MELVNDKYAEIQSSNKSHSVGEKMQASEKQQILSEDTSIIEQEQGREGEKKRMRCLTEKQRQVLVAIFGTSLSAAMTIFLIYLLNQIRG